MCSVTAYWRDLAVDSLLELAALREQLSRRDEDLIQLVAAKRFAFYRKLGGQALTEGAFRAKVRHQLRTGQEI